MRDKKNLFEKFNQVDPKNSEFILDELDRLESLIKGYEISMVLVKNRFDSDQHKNPKVLK